jgi:hypothetical protein
MTSFLFSQFRQYRGRVKPWLLRDTSSITEVINNMQRFWSNIYSENNIRKVTEDYPFVTLHNTNPSLSLSFSLSHTHTHTHSFRENLNIPRKISLNNHLKYGTGPRYFPSLVLHLNLNQTSTYSNIMNDKRKLICDNANRSVFLVKILALSHPYSLRYIIILSSNPFFSYLHS